MKKIHTGNRRASFVLGRALLVAAAALFLAPGPKNAGSALAEPAATVKTEKSKRPKAAQTAQAGHRPQSPRKKQARRRSGGGYGQGEPAQSSGVVFGAGAGGGIGGW